jgi:FkbM family methyltransferase
MKKIIKKIMKRIGYSISKNKSLNLQNLKQVTRDDFFDFYFFQIDKNNFFFVQIGANDGKTNDPIYHYVTKYQLSGVVIEPQPDVFLLLQENYKRYPEVKCLNLAIAKETGSVSFYSVKEFVRNKINFSRLTGIASFDRNFIKQKFQSKQVKGSVDKRLNADDCILETKIRASSFAGLIKENKIEKIDFLQIDCEGYDYEILKTVDFNKFSPMIINFESQNLSDDDRKECEKMLEDLGYGWFRSGSDTCAYKVN